MALPATLRVRLGTSHPSHGAPRRIYRVLLACGPRTRILRGQSASRAIPPSPAAHRAPHAPRASRLARPTGVAVGHAHVQGSGAGSGPRPASIRGLGGRHDAAPALPHPLRGHALQEPARHGCAGAPRAYRRGVHALGGVAAAARPGGGGCALSVPRHEPTAAPIACPGRAPARAVPARLFASPFAEETSSSVSTPAFCSSAGSLALSAAQAAALYPGLARRTADAGASAVSASVGCASDTYKLGSECVGGRRRRRHLAVTATPPPSPPSG